MIRADLCHHKQQHAQTSSCTPFSFVSGPRLDIHLPYSLVLSIFDHFQIRGDFHSELPLFIYVPNECYRPTFCFIRTFAKVQAIQGNWRNYFRISAYLDINYNDIEDFQKITTEIVFCISNFLWFPYFTYIFHITIS